MLWEVRKPALNDKQRTELMSLDLKFCQSLGYVLKVCIQTEFS